MCVLGKFITVLSAWLNTHSLHFLLGTQRECTWFYKTEILKDYTSCLEIVSFYPSPASELNCLSKLLVLFAWIYFEQFELLNLLCKFV